MADAEEKMLPQNSKEGTQVVDPTRNVLDLVEAAVKRLDDLAVAREDKTTSLATAESRRVDEQMALRAEYTEKLAVAEAKRIDAIRAVDVNAVAVASERAAAQAQVLATQVSASAETLRTLVATSASALATQLTQLINPITDRISLLEKAQYEGAGKARATDPALEALVNEVKKLSAAQDTNTGKGLGTNALIAYIIAAISIIGGAIALFAKLG